MLALRFFKIALRRLWDFLVVLCEGKSRVKSRAVGSGRLLGGAGRLLGTSWAALGGAGAALGRLWGGSRGLLEAFILGFFR